VAAVVLALTATACAGPGERPAPPPEPTGAPWVSPHGRDHPLAGRVFEVARGAEIGEERLLDALARARFVLLGEQHENADHHRLQARVLRGLVARGRAPAVAFEMLARDVQPALDEALAARPPRADAVRAAVRWDASGWPDFALYAPVFEVALAAGLPLAAADLARAERAALAAESEPFAALRDRLGLDEPLPHALSRALEADLLAAHCGMLPAAALPRLVRVQRGRDAALARALVEAGGADGAVLVAGAEHARRDRGVPRALARVAPGAPVASLAFVEVTPGADVALADLPRAVAGAPVFDFVWYTPRASDEDPCTRMRR